MVAARQVIVELSQEDIVLLARLKAECQATGADVLRWSLRWYAETGPWHVGSVLEHRRQLGITLPQLIGPAHGRVAL